MLILLIIILLLLFYGVVYLIRLYFSDQRRHRKIAPYVGSYRSHKKVLREQIDRRMTIGKHIWDLWCGDGGMLRFRVKTMWCREGTGYEIRRFPVMLWNVINRLLFIPTVHIIRADFLKVDIGQYDIIYLFLWPSIVADLEPRIREHAKKNALIVTSTFHFVDWIPEKELCDASGKNIVRVYKV